MSARPEPIESEPGDRGPADVITRPAPFDLKTALTLTRTPDADPGAAEEDAGDAERAASLPPGVVLNGRYRVDRLLGRGGMGAVYRVDDQLYPGRPTALKLFLRRVTHSVDLFRAEFRTMASLRHPNVARVYDFEMVAGLDAFFFTMELLQGSTLSHALLHEDDQSSLTAERSDENETPLPREPAGRAPATILPWPETVELLVPVIRALSYLHSRKVVHFDLKPSNIMVSPRRQGRQVKVVDFGLAGLRGATGQVMGTPEYLSPEIARRSKGDHRSDLYSLGVMAYQLLTGKVPYDTTGSVPKLLLQKTTERVRFAPGESETVPLWLRQAIERLCAIEPEERHQSAAELLDELNRAGGLAWELETQDTRESYLFSSQFVGRRRELEEVQRFIDAGLGKRAQGGLLVAGKSGMGKSRLMREVRQAVQLRGVPFLEADCFERDLSESGPMANLVLQAAGLARSVDGAALLSKYGPEMVKLVPSLVLDAGAAPTPPLENADAERRRMIDAVAEFLVGLGRVTPYVAYLNDLQWAREGTTDLIAAILRLRSEAGSGSGLCLLGSFRSDDVGDRPLARLLAGGSRSSVKLVELTPLEDLYVAELLKSMLGLSDLPEGLATRVAEASGGLPFFVEEILRDLLEEGRLAVLQGATMAGAAEALGLRFDASASFLKRTARVSPEERQVLDVLAVCGRPAEPGVVAQVAGLSASAVADALHVLSEKQMVVAVAGARERYNLAHDRMREALYSSLTEDVRSALHLGLARSLASALDREERGETLFETVGHFEQALRLLPRSTDEGSVERTAVARLHLRAALATNATGAFKSGVSYLERAKALLPRDAFEREYALALAIEHTLASTLLPLGRIDEALAAADRIVANAKSVLDEAPGWEARILAYTARNEYPKAIAAGLEICGRLGLSLPASPTLLDIAAKVAEVLWRLRGRTDEDLVSLPRITDERAIRLIRIMTSMNSGAYVTRPYLWPILISHTFILTLRHGRGPTHALRFAWFATALCAVGLYRTAIRFERLSTRLMDAPDGAAFLPKLHHAMGQFLSHWREPMTRSVEWCRTGVTMGERVEDAEFTGYCHMGWAKASLEAGEPLREVRKTCLDALETIRVAGQRGTEVMHRPTLEAVEMLMGLSPLPEDFANDANGGGELSNAQNGFRLLDKARVLCFFRKPASLSLGDDLIRVTTIGLPASFYFSVAHYFAAMGWLLAARAPGTSAWSKLSALGRVLRVRWTLSRWSRSCPQNFEHRALLVEAEWRRTLGQRRRAIRKYEEAVAAAREHGFIQDAALASELLAEVLMESGRANEATPHRQAALDGHRAWGADAKVRELPASSDPGRSRRLPISG